MRAVIPRGTGARDLAIAEIDEPRPGPGEAVVRVAAAGVNFLDVYQRQAGGSSQQPLGMEGAGTIESIDPEADHGLAPGDRVAWTMHRGSYAELATVPADRLVPVPAAIPLELAAGAMLQGLTAGYLTTDSYRVGSGDRVLVHACAGGVGRLVCQLCVAKGARVIGTVSSEGKREVALEAGAEAVLRYDSGDFAEEVRELTAGGVDVVFDGVNRATFEGDLRALRTRGTLVLFGQASGQTEPISPKLLRKHGSLKLTYPGLEHFIAEREDLLARSRELFAAIDAGSLRLAVSTYDLSDAARAHADLEGRRTTGKLVLVP